MNFRGGKIKGPWNFPNSHLPFLKISSDKRTRTKQNDKNNNQAPKKREKKREIEINKSTIPANANRQGQQPSWQHLAIQWAPIWFDCSLSPPPWCAQAAPTLLPRCCYCYTPSHFPSDRIYRSFLFQGAQAFPSPQFSHCLCCLGTSTSSSRERATSTNSTVWFGLLLTVENCFI